MPAPLGAMSQDTFREESSMIRGMSCLSRGILYAIAALVLSASLSRPFSAQQPSPGVTAQNLQRARTMLKRIQKDLHGFYYDSTFRGIDIDKQFREADSALTTAPSNNHMWAIIAQVLENLKDSHTTFYPPNRVASIDYGFGMEVIGDSVYVARVKKDSDADKKGLKVGDVVLMLDAFKVDRKGFGTLMYVYHALSPRPGMRLVVRSPEGQQREIIAMAKIKDGDRIIDYTNPSTITRLIQREEAADRAPRHFWREIGDTVMIWRMPSFFFGDRHNIDEMMDLARKHKALILDLRNNGGGAVVTEQYLVSKFFDRKVMIATTRERKKTDTLFTEPRDKNPFRGLLVVLVNSGSASASEITARVLQLEGRAIVVGDRTAGAVMTSIGYGDIVGFDRVAVYGLSVTVSDVIMADGNRLEEAGVIPDEIVLPTGADIAAKRDPAMARALAIAV
ncbi:MAG: S41 family peptidase [Gemmatimonadaceae bacterium]